MSDTLGQLAAGLKRLATIKKDMDDLQFKEIILSQRELLLEAKEEILRLREELAALAEKLKERSAKDERSDNLIEVEGFHYDKIEGKPVGLPYCTKCYVSEDGRLYRLKRSNSYYSKCPNCNNLFNAAANGSVHEKSPPIKVRNRRVI